jgi:hypothetical protein
MPGAVCCSSVNLLGRPTGSHCDVAFVVLGVVVNLQFDMLAQAHVWHAGGNIADGSVAVHMRHPVPATCVRTANGSVL